MKSYAAIVGLVAANAEIVHEVGSTMMLVAPAGSGDKVGSGHLRKLRWRWGKSGNC